MVTEIKMPKVVLHVIYTRLSYRMNQNRAVNIFIESSIHNPYLNMKRVIASGRYESVFAVIGFTSSLQ